MKEIRNRALGKGRASFPESGWAMPLTFSPAIPGGLGDGCSSGWDPGSLPCPPGLATDPGFLLAPYSWPSSSSGISHFPGGWKASRASLHPSKSLLCCFHSLKGQVSWLGFCLLLLPAIKTGLLEPVTPLRMITADSSETWEVGQTVLLYSQGN